MNGLSAARSTIQSWDRKSTIVWSSIWNKIQFDFPATHSLCCRGNETLHDNKLKIRENSTLDSLDLCLSFDLRATEIKFQAFSHGVFRHQRAPNCTIQCHRINRERFVHTNTEKYLTQFFLLWSRSFEMKK